MSSTKPISLLSVVDELYLLLAESAEYQTQEAVRRVLKLAAGTVQRIRRRMQLALRRYTVAVVGLGNVGKSTLLNALLGADVAPRRNGPCTAAPIEFAYGPELQAMVVFQSSLQRRVVRLASTTHLHELLSQLADEAVATDTGHAVGRVVVHLPHPLLQGDMVLADTPGFGAAQAGGDAGSHEQALRQYLQDDVSQVFWVVLADQGIGKREIDFHNDWFKDICDDVVVTGCEDWTDQDRQRYRHCFAGQFHERIPRFHFVSGLLGLAARERGDAAALEQAGIPLLEHRIRELATRQGRESMLRTQLQELACDTAYWLTEHRDVRGRPLETWWRPDSWMRWSANTSNTAVAQSLSTDLQPR